MEEINHFSHEEHSLKLIENWETVAGVGSDDDDDDGKKGMVNCDGCRKPISISSGGSAYGCVSCRYFMHKACTELTPTINHRFHTLHPLTLKYSRIPYWKCDVCDYQDRVGGFSYQCLQCDFDACIKCGGVAIAEEVAAVALKKEASVKFEHEGHPQHTLTLQLRSASFYCDACHTEDRDLFYQCDDCDFWIHKTCSSLASTFKLPHHPKHPLVLVYSLPDNFYNFAYHCEFCQKRILHNDWLYHCANCRYFAHIKCALHAEEPSTPRDGPGTSSVAEDQLNDLLQFPMFYAFTDPLKQLHSAKIAQDKDDETTIEIKHWIHDHPLILNVVAQGNYIDSAADPIEVCYGCVRPLSFPYYTCKDGCSFSLHKYCAELPLTLQKHQLHPHHPLELVALTGGHPRQCCGCRTWGNTFLYECQTCNFWLDINCAFLPNTIKHERHKDPLIQVIDYKSNCDACNSVHSGIISYACKDCNFQLDMYCATRFPSSLGYMYCEGHEILLTYPPVEDHPEDFYCEICEKEIHPKFPLYYCQKCKNSSHLDCLSQIDAFANIWSEGTRTESYHQHLLTFVRRKKTPEYVCSKCNCDINGRLILECRAEACNFNICFTCHNEACN